MKRLRKAIIAILCVVCLACGAFACGDDDSDSAKATYTVTVTGATEMELEFTTVKLLKENGEDAAQAKPLALSADKKSGTVTFSLEKGKYTVVVTGHYGDRVPLGNMQLTSAVRSTTITIGTPPVETVTKEYRVRFVLPDNTPVPNISVQICSDQCHLATTDDNGWATWNVAADTYVVHVTSKNDWPAGYYFDDDAYKLTVSKTEITAKFIAYGTRTVTVKYATYDSTLNEWQLTDPAANVSLKVSLYDDDAAGGSETALTTVTTDASGIATFSSVNDDLWVDVVGGVQDGYAQGNESTYINGKDKTAGLTIGLYPVGATIDTCPKMTLDTETTVSALASGYVWYEFVPTQSGEYTLTSTGNVNASCTMPSAISLTGDISASYAKNGKNFTIKFNVGASEIGTGNRWVFKIAANEGEFKINLTRSGDYEEEKAPDRETVTANNIVAVANHPAVEAGTKFGFLAANAELVKGADGYYHLGSATGAVVYATLGNKYAPARITGGFKGIIESSTGTKSIILTDGKTFSYDYTTFVRNYCDTGLNADGVHPLNDELKTFLELYNARVLSGSGCNYACGTYSTNSGETPVGGALSLGANTVTGTSDGATYTFTATKAGTYTVTFGATGDVSVETNDSDGDDTTGGNIETITSGYSIELKVGETLTLICYPKDINAVSVTFTLTITKA